MDMLERKIKALREIKAIAVECGEYPQYIIETVKNGKIYMSRDGEYWIVPKGEVGLVSAKWLTKNMLDLIRVGYGIRKRAEKFSFMIR